MAGIGEAKLIDLHAHVRLQATNGAARPSPCRATKPVKRLANCSPASRRPPI